VSGFGIFHIRAGATLNISGLTLAHGEANSGGAITNQGGIVNITNCVFRDNHANSGGGLANEGGVATVRNTMFVHNHATGGGGIANENGVLQVEATTFVGDGGTSGGGIENFGGVMTVLNSTFEGSSEGGAGAIQNILGLVALGNLTIRAGTGNPGRAIRNFPGGTVRIANSILVGAANHVNCEGEIINLGNNLQFPGSDCGRSIPTADPRLGPLQDNGGPTLTIGLDPGSPAIGAMVCPLVPQVDQRGAPRPMNAWGQTTTRCDIGAFESHSNPPH
jgi:hypothetical protein